MKITGNTNLSDIVKSFQGANDDKNLRLQESGNTKTLKIHDGLLPSGWGENATKRRELKHQAAVNLIKNLVSAQFPNNPRVVDSLFQKLGIKGEVSVGTLKRLEQEVSKELKSINNREQGVELQKEVSLMGRQMHGWMEEIEKQVLDQVEALPKAKPHQMATPKDDKFRTSVPDEDRKSAMQKASGTGIDSLDLAEAVGCLKSVYENNPVMSLEKVITLINHESVSTAVGIYTGKNGLGSGQEVGKGIGSGMMKHSAAQLRDVIKDNLTQTEIQDLKKRIDFLNELAPRTLDHFGKTHKDVGREEGIKYWTKSIAVSYGLFVGHRQDAVQHLDNSSLKETSIKGRDLITALAIHSDIIFGDEQVDQLAFLDGPEGNNHNGRFIPLMDF
ncbi:MAG: hypothetical protein ACO1TE_13190 [Prosthecobacter sp.]